MSTNVPNSLFHAGRAQCPDCGASLLLREDLPQVSCDYCGGTATVERRLRTIEPVIEVGFMTADAPLGQARDVRPSQVIAGVAQDEAHCPNCAAELDVQDASQAIRICPYCQTQSKIERRLRRSPAADEALAAMERDADEPDRRQFAQTEALLAQVEASAHLRERVRAARELGGQWNHVNARAATLLPRVLEIMRTAPACVEIPLSELVGKLLCSDDAVLSNAVLRAAEKFTFDVQGSHALLRALGLGSGVGVKLLLDTADYAATRGAMVYACSALWAINTMIERNYAGRMRLAEIVLYRLLYLRGPVQAWAIELAQGQMGLGCRFETPELLHFVDDCALERRELVPLVLECFYDGGPASGEEYQGRLKRVQGLFTAPAKCAAIEHAYVPPPDTSEAVIEACLSMLLEYLRSPDLRRAASDAICRLIEEDSNVRPSVHTMVQSLGEGLPEDVRRAYLARVPGSKLLQALPVRYRDYPAEVSTEADAMLAEWKAKWNEHVRQAVDFFQQRQQQAREYDKAGGE